jgi:hypothetical protein
MGIDRLRRFIISPARAGLCALKSSFPCRSTCPVVAITRAACRALPVLGVCQVGKRMLFRGYAILS